MKSLALQPWKWFSSQWGLPSANQLCATEKPLNIFGPLYCGDNVCEAKLQILLNESSPPLSLPPSLSLPSVIGFLNNFSSFFFTFLSAAVETLLLICPGVICLRGVPERIDRVKSRLLTPPVPKHIHSPALLTPSFLCQAADTNWHIGGGREEGEGELGSGGCCPADQWIGQSAVFLSDVSCTSRNLSTDN